MTDLTTVISTVGFPIACCIGLGFFINNVITANREDSSKREDRLFQELGRFASSQEMIASTLTTLDNRVEKLETHKCEN
ncbi:MAG: hypothetical protein RR500_04870 [Bacilli bacterium]